MPKISLNCCYAFGFLSTEMGKTFKHKLNVKHRIGLIENPPIFMRKFWNRTNFDKGEFLALRAKKVEIILKKEMECNLDIYYKEN